MEVILSVEALKPPLTGIGRYTWEIAKRINHSKELNSRFYLNGQWIAPSSINDAHHVNLQPTAKWLNYLPRKAKKYYWQHTGRNTVFHGPNYFVPPWAENAIATIHDLSVFKFPETHPIERVKQFERLFTASVNQSAYLNY
ncbi:hypothetical protein [Deefgea sp. CFH1-16]|uniref:hypothetical protein n=1 Tax=Deefgea sp. CFH1-16 TaxID=2675457 RepID=UPI0015F71FF0|nr:hypothetical protein [Deefgea sp. CFH1-16]MBM5574156.1 hypothetical protein [Deefgea sp. CFH1-16]